jgi:hypothetical protein
LSHPGVLIPQLKVCQPSHDAYGVDGESGSVKGELMQVWRPGEKRKEDVVGNIRCHLARNLEAPESRKGEELQ